MNKLFIKIREDDFNINLINYLLMFYVFSMMISSKIHGTILYIILVIFFLNENIKNHLILSFKNKFVQACLLYLLVILVWMIGSEDLSYAIVQLKINKFYLLPLLFFAIIKMEFFDKFIYIFLFGLSINIFWTFLMFFNIIENNFDSLLIMQVDQSFLIFIVVTYAIYKILLDDNTIKTKFILFVLVLLCSFNIFLLKKTAVVSYLIIICILMLYIYRKNIIKLISTFFIFSCLFILALNYLMPDIKEQLLHEANGVKKAFIENDYTNSMSARLGVAKFALEAIKDKIIFGYGTGDHSFAVINKIEQSDIKILDYNSYYTIIGTLITGKHVTLHNTFLQVLVQYGILGFIVFLMIFYRLLQYVILAKKNIYSAIILIMIVNAFLQFSSGWDFQFGNYGQMYIFTTVLLIKLILDKNKIYV
ncbi:O-antigen ligase family protein [Aliarcobacter butzleri]|uniref:O-antigen ligase family protein n=1 Tax=Aliarcobacter butzleri TaxID=28197 RepID=UPI0013EEE500|nr:O-antigen polymerase [Aliarcobacter butzleri]